MRCLHITRVRISNQSLRLGADVNALPMQLLGEDHYDLATTSTYVDEGIEVVNFVVLFEEFF